MVGLGTKRILHPSGKAPLSFCSVSLREQTKTSNRPCSVCSLTFVLLIPEFLPVCELIGGGTIAMVGLCKFYALALHFCQNEDYV